MCTILQESIQKQKSERSQVQVENEQQEQRHRQMFENQNQKMVPMSDEDEPVVAEDMSVTVEQSSKKKKDPVIEKNIAVRSREEQYGSFSEARRIAFEECLLRDIQEDAGKIQKDNSEEYIKAVEALKTYRDIREQRSDYMEEGKILGEARTKLRSALEVSKQKEKTAQKEQMEIIKKEKEVLERYILYFDTFCDGLMKKDFSDPLSKEQDCKDKQLHVTDATTGKVFMKKVYDFPLFSHEPNVNDIHQGALGDCYFEAALASLVSEQPKKIKEMMKDNGDDTVTICLYKIYNKESDLPDNLPVELEEARKSLNKNEPNKMSNYDIVMRLLEYSKVEKSELNDKLGLFEHTDNIYNVLEDADKFARKLSQDERLKLVFEEVRKLKIQEEQDLGKMIKDTVSKKMLAMKIDKDALKKEYEAEHNALNKRPMHKQYVTVTKEIPLIKRNETGAYSRGALWVHLYQKAYTASDIRSAFDKYAIVTKIKNKLQEDEKKLKQFAPNISKNAKKAMLDDLEKEYENWYNDSYEKIEGGLSTEAFGMLTGIQLQPLEKKPITYQEAETEVENLKQDPKAIQKIKGALLNFTEDEMEIFFTGLKNCISEKYKSVGTGTNEHRYTDSAITIEDIKEMILNVSKWKNSNLYEVMYQKMKGIWYQKSEDELKNKVALQFSMLAEQLADYYENLEERFGFQHRRFSSKEEGGVEKGLYTKYALELYEKIQETLKQKKPLALGTYKFIPQVVQEILKTKKGQSGGEAIRGGLAEGHAYSILECNEIDGRKYIAVRNPWGRVERTYNRVTKPGENNEPPVVEYEVEEVKVQQGHFNLELNDMMNSASRIYGL